MMTTSVVPATGGQISVELTEDGYYDARRPSGSTERAWYKVYVVKIKPNAGYAIAEAKLTRTFIDYIDNVEQSRSSADYTATPTSSQIPAFRLRLDDDGWYHAEFFIPRDIHGRDNDYSGIAEYRYFSDDVAGSYWETFADAIEATFVRSPVHTNLILRSSVSGKIIRSEKPNGLILRDA